MTSILVFNWKDIRNPNAGGAELYTQEVFSRLAKKYGHKVTLFTSSFAGADSTDQIDGIDVVRRGARFTVYGQAKTFYKERGGDFEIIFDEINTRPFLTPTFVKKGSPIVAIIHQLAREYWWYETPFPVSALGYYFLESRWLKNYLNVPTVTVSNSTLNQLKAMGFTKVEVIHNGVSITPLERLPVKRAKFTAVFVGRLSKVKRPDDAIRAFLEAGLEDGSRMFVVGDGQLRRDLIRKYSSRPEVEFLGRVSDEKKADVVRQAHVHLAPYLREGWGNTIIEASALATPTIGYSTPGLVDSIQDDKTGFLVQKFDVRRLTEKIEFAFQNPDEIERVALNGLRWARSFSWDESAKRFDELIERTLRGKGRTASA